MLSSPLKTKRKQFSVFTWLQGMKQNFPGERDKLKYDTRILSKIAQYYSEVWKLNIFQVRNEHGYCLSTR
jgi:hypothetical protein